MLHIKRRSSDIVVPVGDLEKKKSQNYLMEQISKWLEISVLRQAGWRKRVNFPAAFPRPTAQL